MSGTENFGKLGFRKKEDVLRPEKREKRIRNSRESGLRKEENEWKPNGGSSMWISYCFFCGVM